MVEQNAHEIAYFCLGSVRQALSIDTVQLLKPALYSHSSDIPNAQRAPMRPYPSLEKLAVDNSRRVGVPVSFIRELSVNVVIDEICNSNRLFALAISVLVYGHS
jgi:hypothetical protein